MNRNQMQLLGQLAIQQQRRNAGIKQEASDRARAAQKRIVNDWKNHIIHTPVKPPSRLTPIVRKCVLTIENLIQFVKGLFK